MDDTTTAFEDIVKVWSEAKKSKLIIEEGQENTYPMNQGMSWGRYLKF
jgi:hypothetical protein